MNPHARYQGWRGRLQRAAFRARYPRVEIINHDGAAKLVLKERGFTAQHGQDEYVLRRFFLDRDKPGYFVDVGGNDPINLNNTYYFESKLGWKGLCVEPLVRFQQAWREHRRAAVAPYAATDRACQLPFDEVELDHWGHVFSAVAGSSDKHGHMPHRRSEVEGRRLSEILDEQGVSHVDFMSLDVEGHEMQALAGIDFERITIDVIAVENNSPGYVMGSALMRRYLEARGFVYVARFWLLDDIFVRQAFWQTISRVSRLRAYLARLRREWRHRRAVARLAGPKVLSALARQRPDAFFIEIGANDGRMMDPLRAVIGKSRWQGLVVEPVPDLYAQLCENYRSLSGRITPINGAVATQDAQLPFHRLRNVAGLPPLPDWAHGLGSFKRDVILTHRDRLPEISSYIEEISVPAMTWETMCTRYGVSSLDVVLTDTEGYDHEILRQLDLVRWRPALLIFEHHHFDAATLEACDERFRQQGYVMFREGLDTWCLDAREPGGVGRDVLQQVPGWIARSAYAKAV